MFGKNARGNAPSSGESDNDALDKKRRSVISQWEQLEAEKRRYEKESAAYEAQAQSLNTAYGAHEKQKQELNNFFSNAKRYEMRGCKFFYWRGVAIFLTVCIIGGAFGVGALSVLRITLQEKQEQAWAEAELQKAQAQTQTALDEQERVNQKLRELQGQIDAKQAKAEAFRLTETNREEADAYLRALPKRSIDALEPVNDGFFRYRQLETGEQYVNRNYATDTLFPGAILNGDSLFRPEYTLVSQKRQPIELMADMPGSGRFLVEDATFAGVHEAIQKLVAQNGDQPIKGTLEHYISYVSDESELNTTVGVGADILNSVKADASMGFHFDEKHTNLIVRFSQIYYQVTMSPNASPQEYFADGSDLSYMGSSAPVYVSTVSYGRVGYLSISSTDSEKVVREAVSASIPAAGGVASVTPKMESEHREILNKSEMRVVINGGTSGNAMQSIDGYDGFMRFFQGGGTMADCANAVPLAYTLKYVADNEPVPCATILRETLVSGNSDLVELELVESSLSNTWIEASIPGVEFLPLGSPRIKSDDNLAQIIFLVNGDIGKAELKLGFRSQDGAYSSWGGPASELLDASKTKLEVSVGGFFNRNNLTFNVKTKKLSDWFNANNRGGVVS